MQCTVVNGKIKAVKENCLFGKGCINRMGFYVNPPADGFEAILKGNRYVDKSELIAYTNHVLGTENMLTCFSRPRRFGKSFAAKMLVAYYSKGADAKALFKNLRIARMNGVENACFEENLNRHDVIFIDITSFISMASDIRETVADLQADIIKELIKTYPCCISEGTTSLFRALMQVHEMTGNKFFIIIDEWDALFREAKDDKKLQQSYIQLLRSMFKSGQTSQVITGAYMTGILPVKKYGTQSALTDFREFTMLEPGPLAPFIGFTEDEVKALCRIHGMDFEKTRKWYDGYRFSDNEHVYCPNSIMELVSRKKFDSYWTKTETYESLRDYIDLDYLDLKDGIVEMLGGKHCRIDTGTFQNDMTSISSRDDIFTLLVHLGYLAYDFDEKAVFIPNEEGRIEFVRAVKEGRRTELAKAVKMSDKLLEATLQMDESAVAKMIEAVHLSEVTPKNYKDEQALRYVVIMAYLSCMDHYLRFEEIASGRGYCDILFLPRRTSSKPALLIELKKDKSTNKAIQQIKEKQYTEIMRQFDYDGKLLLIGINYSTKTGRHTCRIEEFHGK